MQNVRKRANYDNPLKLYWTMQIYENTSERTKQCEMY